ncbi:pig-Q [Malassezia pachydermatis]
MQGAEWPGLGALALTGLAIGTATTLAEACYARDTRPTHDAPIYDASYLHIPISRQRRPLTFQCLRIYVPTTLACSEAQPYSLFGWSFDGGGGAWTIVVAGATPSQPQRMDVGPMPVTQLGWALPPHSVEDKRLAPCSPITLSFYGYKHGVPHLTVQAHTDHPWARHCPVSWVLYTPPNVLGEQFFTTFQHGPTASWPPTRLEHLLSMNPDRCHEWVSSAPTCPRPGTGLRQALVCMNMAMWVTTAPPSCPYWLDTIVSVTSSFTVWPVLSKYAAYLSTWSMTFQALKMQWYAMTRWPVYLASRRAVYCAVAAGRMPPMDHVQSLSFETWQGLLFWIVDRLLGTLVAWIFARHISTIVTYVQTFFAYAHATHFQALFSWLVHWPLGIKLNTELALLVSDVLGGIVTTHTTYLLTPLSRMLPAILQLCMRLAPWLGVSVITGLWCDLWIVMHSQVVVLHVVLREVYAFFWYAAAELFDIFRGKKRNPLHGWRLDDAYYDVDQLFLGTMLFTMLAFLFPTVLLFYVACTLPYALVRLVHTWGMVCIHALHELPSYIGWLRVPRDVIFVPCRPGYYRLQSTVVAPFQGSGRIHATSIELFSDVPGLLYAILVGRKTY